MSEIVVVSPNGGAYTVPIPKCLNCKRNLPNWQYFKYFDLCPDCYEREMYAQHPEDNRRGELE